MKFSPFAGSPLRTLLCLLALPVLFSLIIQPSQAHTAQPQALLAEADKLLEDGDTGAALKICTAASKSADRQERLAGLIGLGKVYRQIPGKRMESLRKLRQAQAMEPEDMEVLYETALTGFALKESSGATIADNALAKIICQDPRYRDAYLLWRVKNRGRSLENMEKAANCLPSHIASHSELNRLWLDIAYDWFAMFKTENSLAALDSLLGVAPEHKPQERFLLRARCLLEDGDTLAFEDYYRQALRAAEQEGDFQRLIIEAKTIFTPDELSSLKSLGSAKQVATFLRVFWRNKDPDPVTLHNERLVEHYQRLRTAELEYKMLTPDGLVQNSDSYLRLMSMRERPTFVFRTDGVKGEPEPYDYDPVRIIGDKGQAMGLDHRGLFFVRHGMPDNMWREHIKEKGDGFTSTLSKPLVSNYYSGYVTGHNAEIWHYKGTKLTFKRGLGTGGFLIYPNGGHGQLDIERALNTQTYQDPLPVKPQNFYSAAFRRADNRLDLEFYQSVPVKDSHSAEPPKALVALYDRSLNELARDSSVSVAAPSPDGELWLAVHSIPVDPADYSFGLSVALPDVRAAVKSNIRLEPISGRNLSLSGIVMGVHSEEEQGAYSRGTVKILPRPSLEFGLDELVETFLEVYNLRPGRNGRRQYEVHAIVVLLEQDRNHVGKLLEKFRMLGQERGTELTMEFERSPTTDDFVVAEFFSINTAELLPGSYLLRIEVKDKLNGSRATAERNFRLVD